MGEGRASGSEEGARREAPWRCVVLLSGTGRTLENLLDRIDSGSLNIRIDQVISSRPGVRGLEIARDAGIPAHVVRGRQYPTLEAYTAAVYDRMADVQPDLVLMAGFLRRILIRPELDGRVLNIHPSLLPVTALYAAGRGMYGDRVHDAVLAHGDVESGATVHVVTDAYDEGPPFMTRTVPVLPGDTAADLAARVFEAECTLYPEAIEAYMAQHPELKRAR